MRTKWFQLWNVAKWRAKLLHVLTMGRTFLLLVFSSMIFFVLLGFGGMVEQRFNSSPVTSMKGFAAALSSGVFMDMLGMEMPHLNKGKVSSTLSGEKMTAFAFQLLTSVNPNDPKSMLAREMPGMGSNDPVLLRTGSGNEDVEAPEDYHPDSGKVVADAKTQQGEVVTPEPVGDPDVIEEEVTPEPGSKKNDPIQGKHEVLIYHSHPRESFNPFLGINISNPNSDVSSKNIMQVGSFIAKELKMRGVGTLHLEKDYASYIQDYNWNYSYKYSRQTVKEALAQNDQLTYLLDIHRDSQRHKKTTTVINNVSYAQMYFIIGHENKNWRQNEAYANAINKRLETSYPGISRGIWGKTAEQGNGEYNQSLSPNSIVIEIGGVDSTKEELQRTSRVLADIIADIYFADQKAQKASAMKTDKMDKTDKANKTDKNTAGIDSKG
ncbi:stage II sporulation protein P [Paenibacillus sp. IHBB 10380]|uniref:stage II sporulation protein P n=1 Tax=Paenibacillus sp. IHBB 10380 TaxID=1566358 RepID=UPI0005CFC431|nr:stage II sporulation protein P [Paenibacillus sp. IHBB 10380]AJS57660.1 stage II sporulation protein P [Paenibacillus sp. IHBB 10380]